MTRNEYEETDSRLDASQPHQYEEPKVDYGNVDAQRNYIVTGLQDMSDACEDGQHSQCHHLLHDLCKCECHKAPAVTEPESVVEQTLEAESSASTQRTYQERVQASYQWIKENRVIYNNNELDYRDWLHDLVKALDVTNLEVANVLAGKVENDPLLRAIERHLEMDSQPGARYAHLNRTGMFYSTDSSEFFGLFGTTPEIEYDEEKRVEHIERSTRGGARPGAGRKPDSAKAHTREPLYQQGYEAGYQAGLRAVKKA